MRLLVTRPEPDNERTAAALRAQGHEVMLAPLLRIEAVPDADLGARAVGRDPDDQRQRRARARGASPARRAAGAAGARGRAQQRRGGAGRGLCRCDLGRRRRRRSGAARRRALRRRAAAAALSRRRGSRRRSGRRAGGQRLAVRTVVVYRAAKADRFPPRVRARRWSRAGSTACCISPAAASRAISIAAATSSGRRSGPTHYCLSARAAEPLQARGRARTFAWPRGRTRRACSLWSRPRSCQA